MTTVTDSDIKEIKEAIAAIAKQMMELSGKVDLTNARIETTKTKIDGLDKRLSIFEAIYQRFFTLCWVF